MKRSQLFGVASGACLLAALAVVGCAAPPDPPMRIGTDSWPGSAPLHLAQRLGSLDDRFRLVDFSTTSESVRSFRNGALDAACVTMDEALRILRDGMDPVILLVLDESRGGDALLAHPRFSSVTDLKGKRIGVELGAGGSLMLTRALIMGGMNVTDVSLIYLPADKHVESFMAGDVDAVVTYEPARTRIKEAGAVDLYNSSMTPGGVIDVLIARGEYVRTHPELVKTIRQAWFAALLHLREKPSAAVSLIAQRLQSPPEQVESMLKGIHMPDSAESKVLIGGAHPSLKDSAVRLMTLMRQYSFLSTDLDVSSLFSAPLD